ncbi:head-tail connector protein [Clostridium sp.]|uniref:head-tail connector protein n=1 Tax=Clostridium sp. TaxID=1506 RepID=UPI003216737B
MLEDLKVLLDINSTDKDALLTILIRKAENVVKNYCKIESVTASLMDTVTDIAVIMYNRIGTEGLTGESFSGVSNNFESDIPKSIKRNLNRHRRVF